MHRVGTRKTEAAMKVALTGAASGIGAAVARKLRKAGHHVTAFDIQDPGPVADCWIRTDFADPVSIESAVQAAGGPFDALINNAGIPPKPDNAVRVLAVNFYGLRRFLDGMLPTLAQGAAVVNTASRAGAMWRDNLEQVKALLAVSDAASLGEFVQMHNIDAVRAYNLSKEAVIVLTMARTEEMLARGLRMNSVSPAAVSTTILDDFVAAFGEKVARNVARVGRPGEVDEIADVIVFLASPQSRWLNGVDLVVDGGMSAMIQSENLGI